MLMRIVITYNLYNVILALLGLTTAHGISQNMHHRTANVSAPHTCQKGLTQWDVSTTLSTGSAKVRTAHTLYFSL